MLRIGIVLGAGGTTGLAFHGGVLAALQEATGWDPRMAEVVVGTSAGSLSASLLRIGLPAPDLRQVTEELPLSPEGAALAELGAPHRPQVHLGGFLQPRMPASIGAAVKGLLAPWSRSPLSTVAAALPAGPISTASISTGLDLASQGHWPASQTWICSSRVRDGKRVVFGRDGSPVATVGQAAAASCAIPGYFQPVAIGGEHYMDGGVNSIHSLDLLAGLGLDLVLVSAPMTFAGRHGPLSGDATLRRYVRFQLDREAGKVRRSGTQVVTLAPTRTLLSAMGVDFLDSSRRAMISRLARRSTLDFLERTAAGPMLEAAAATTARPFASPAA